MINVQVTKNQVIIFGEQSILDKYKHITIRKGYGHIVIPELHYITDEEIYYLTFFNMNLLNFSLYLEPKYIILRYCKVNPTFFSLIADNWSPI
jgi:hypothetical protein